MDGVVAEMKTVLVVEDDSRIAKALDIRLKAHGYRVVSAPDAVRAMTVATGQVPDVVVLDINLPGGSGLMIAERMLDNAVTTDIPVIFITASKQAKLRERAAELSAVAFLEKPFSSADLLDAIDVARSRQLSDIVAPPKRMPIPVANG